MIRTQLIPLRDDFFKAIDVEVVWNEADADDSSKAITAAVNWTSTGILVCLALSAGVAGIARDVGKRLRAEQKLGESEERFREVFEHAPVGMCISGIDGRVIQVNTADRCSNLLPRAVEEFRRFKSTLEHTGWV